MNIEKINHICVKDNLSRIRREIWRKCSRFETLYIMNLLFPETRNPLHFLICAAPSYMKKVVFNLKKWFRSPDAVTIIVEAYSRGPSARCRGFCTTVQIDEAKLPKSTSYTQIRPCIAVKADRSFRWFKKFGTSLTPAKFTPALNLPSRRGHGLSSALVLARMTLTIRKLKVRHFVPAA